ncbi:MAG: T9SS type A sorting domain-containing protein [Bacteroidales bacterium]|nr:T9SS type A sorting domain-containing protein [Bacteroidales bacterium]
MKNHYPLLAIILFISVTLEVAGQDFTWIYSTAYYGIGRTASCDSEGNVYVAGEFILNASFCDTSITTPNNTANIFFCKFDPGGNCIWVKNIGGSLYETCFEVATDSNDDVYITGMFDGTVSFGDFELTTAGLYDIFLAKYSPSGECLWVVQAGGESFFDHALTLDFDSQDNVYITGCFEHTATFGDTIVSSGVPSGGNPNVEWGGETFVAKYSTNGDFVWVKYIPGTHHINRGHSIAVTSEDNIFVSGKFEGEMYFENDITSSFGAFDAFHFMLDSDGNTLWANNAGSILNDKPTPSGIAVDENNNIYVTGFFEDTADFNGTQITSNGGWDIYLAKYDPAGNLVWIRNDGGEENERAYGIAINENKIFIAGYMYGNSVYNNEVILTSYGARDLFVACYDTDGDFYWADNHGGPGDDWAFQITSDHQDSYYITGFHNNDAVFGDTTLNTGQYQNLFIAKFTDTTIVTGKREITRNKDNVLIYPNPVNDHFIIHFNKHEPKPFAVRIFDLQGKLISFQTISLTPEQNNFRIETSTLHSGIYIAKLHSNDGVATFKILKR